jgi:predicted dehydrogenase
MKVTLFGCGGWGSRVAAKLSARPDVRLALVDADEGRVRSLADRLGCAWSIDPYGYLGVTGTADGSLTGGMVVIATPPSERVRLVRAVLEGYGEKPVAIRVEKPLAETAEQAAQIVQMCEDADVALTVGFTLLHHPLYAAAFAYMNAIDSTPIHVDAVRIGRPARHTANAFVDAGIHAASVAAYLGVPAGIAAAYDDDTIVRSTRIYTDAGKIVVDEVAGTVTTPHGLIGVGGGDALDRDLDAWMRGTHRGTPEVALDAQRIIDTHVECGVAA